MNIGERIRTARKVQKLTQKQLAEKAGVAEISIRNYENQNRQPKLEQLQKIAAALEVSIEYFAGAPDPTPTSAFYDWLLSLGYKVVFYEEEDWHNTILRDLETYESCSVSFDELNELEKQITSFTRFQIKELFKSKKTNQRK